MCQGGSNWQLAVSPRNNVAGLTVAIASQGALFVENPGAS